MLSRSLRSFRSFFTMAFAWLLLAAAPTVAQTPTLTTDQADYPPGATCTLTGAGFAPGETVRMQVLHADPSHPSTGEEHDPWYVTADGNGGFRWPGYRGR